MEQKVINQQYPLNIVKEAYFPQQIVQNPVNIVCQQNINNQMPIQQQLQKNNENPQVVRENSGQWMIQMSSNNGEKKLVYGSPEMNAGQVNPDLLKSQVLILNENQNTNILPQQQVIKSAKEQDKQIVSQMLLQYRTQQQIQQPPVVLQHPITPLQIVNTNNRIIPAPNTNFQIIPQQGIQQVNQTTAYPPVRTANLNYQVSSNQTQQLVEQRRREEDFPDCTYCSKGGNPYEKNQFIAITKVDDFTVPGQIKYNSNLQNLQTYRVNNGNQLY